MTSTDMGFGFAAAPPGRSSRQIFVHEPPLAAVLRAALLITDTKGSDPAAINKPILVGFRNAYVFDVAQTDGAELPKMREIYGSVGDNRERVVAFIKAQGTSPSPSPRSPS